jgi:hypothetical protein
MHSGVAVFMRCCWLSSWARQAQQNCYSAQLIDARLTGTCKERHNNLMHGAAPVVAAYHVEDMRARTNQHVSTAQNVVSKGT